MQTFYKLSFLCAFALLRCPGTQAQQRAVQIPGEAVIASYELEATTELTSTLLFPSAVKSIDHGNNGLLVKTTEGVENLLKLKAARPDFTPTNLTVYTNDGRIYIFWVHYAAAPKETAYDLSRVIDRVSGPGPLIFDPGLPNGAEIANLARAVAAEKPYLHGPRDRSGEMRLRLKGIFLYRGVLFISMALRNSSKIPYQVDFTRCYVRDHNQPKRTARMEKELQPLYIYSSAEAALEPGEQSAVVIALRSFTLAPGRNFMVELFEREGERRLSIAPRSGQLLQARNLPPMQLTTR